MVKEGPEQPKPVMEGVLEVGPPPRLRGAICPSCNRKFFPIPMVCPYCLIELQSVRLSSVGKIYTLTIVRTKPPFGLPQPYAVGYVDLEEDGLRIFGLFDPQRIADLHLGQRVKLDVGVIGVDPSGEPCLRYYFTPEGADG